MPNNKPRKLILASTSPFRKQLLNKLLVPFETASPLVDETPLSGERPIDLVQRLAFLKALAVAKQHNSLTNERDAEGALVIGSDQVAVFNGEILGKPHNHENAVKQLSKFSGNRVTFLTGLSVIDSITNESKTIVEPFDVEFKTLSHQIIESYLQAEQPYNCAGSFKSEGLGICLFDKLQGDDPNSLIGLPLIRLIRIFDEFGYDLFSDQP
jgi:MAF protein